MAYELVYTSAPAGLTRGSSGFCVVACTQGLGPRLMVTLEGLSAYKPLYPHYAPNAWDNPISRSHYLYEANGELQHILSRTCFNGVDHTQRSNKLASHLVLSKAEADIASGGPTSLLLHEELFKNAKWEIKAEYFPTQKTIPQTTSSYAKCTTWEKTMGDAGWGGYLAQLYVDSPNKNVYIAYRPEQNDAMLSLLHEAISLLPDTLRWQVTFNTYFVNLPAGMSCSWRCCPVDSDALRTAKRSPANIIIDITQPQKLDKTGELITLARTGIKNDPIPPKTVVDEKISERKMPKLTIPNKLKVPEQPSEVSSPAAATMVSHSSLPPAGNLSSGYTDSNMPDQMQSRRSFWLIALIVFIVATLAGASVYTVKNIKNKNLYAEQKNKCQTWMEALSSVRTRKNEVARKKTNLQKVQDANTLIEEVEELILVVESIKKEAEKLQKYQYLFENYESSSGDAITVDNSPQTLIDSCESEKNSLTKDLSDLKKQKTDLKERAEKLAKALDKKPAKKPAQATVPQEKTLPPLAPKKVATKDNKVPPPVQLPMDEKCYLWEKSAELHRLNKGEKVEVKIGNYIKDDLFIAILPNVNDFKKIGVKLDCGRDVNDRDVLLSTEFESGKLYIILNSLASLNQSSEILLRIKGDDYPLFFRLDVSKLIPVKNSGNLQINYQDNSIILTIPYAGITVPKEYFNEKNASVKPSMIIQTVRHAYELALKEDEKNYIARMAIPDLKKAHESLNTFIRIEKDINESCVKYMQKLNSRKELKTQISTYQDCHKKYKKLDDNRRRLQTVINDSETLEDIAEFLDVNDKDLTADKLKKKADKLPKDKGKWKRFAKKYSAWLKAFEDLKKEHSKYNDAKKALANAEKEIAKVIIEKIPLKNLKEEYSQYSSPLGQSKRNAEKHLKDIKAKLETEIRNGSLYLQYAGKNYEQFAIKALKQ